MIKILLHCFSDICITDADCLFQIGIESLLDGDRVIFQEDSAKILQFFHVFFIFPLEPFANLTDKDPLYFPVWNDKLCQFPGLCTALCQIPDCKEYAPQVIRIEVKIPVCQFLTDCFFMLFPLISCSISFLSDVFALLKNLLIISLLLVFTQ